MLKDAHRETDALLVGPGGERLRGKVVLVTSFACVSGLLLGYDIGVTNGSLEPVAATFGLRDVGKELYVGYLNCAALPGCVLGGWLADLWGRRCAILVGTVLFLVAGAAMITATTFDGLLCGRAMAGIAVGMTLVTAPLYTSEVSPTRLRGMISTNVEISMNAGILLGFLASWGLSVFQDSLSWRLMIAVSCVAPLFTIVALVLFIPESPRWLALRGRLDEAEAVVRDLYGPQEAATVTKALRQLASDDAGLKEMDWQTMLGSPHVRPLMWAACGVAFFSQATGVETVMYYSSEILLAGGMSKEGMLAATSAMGVVKLISILVSGYFVDSYGRKPLLMISSLGMFVSMSAMGFTFLLGTPVIVTILAIQAFVVSFSLGYGPIVYTLSAEIYPTRCRSKGVSLSMSMARIVSAVVSISFLTLSEALKISGAFFFYAGICLAAAAFVALFVPETKGLTLEGGLLSPGRAES